MANALKQDRELERHERDWWGYLGETEDYETRWNTYLDELRYVLDDVGLLLENVDSKVAISADHGEDFGEYWEYGHHTGSVNPYVRKVPYIETTATDQHTHTPTTKPPVEDSVDDANTESTEDQLEALGYKM